MLRLEGLAGDEVYLNIPDSYFYGSVANAIAAFVREIGNCETAPPEWAAAKIDRIVLTWERPKAPEEALGG